MSDEVFSTTLAYTKSPKVTKRTSFQDELIKAITARSARQRSWEYSDDFDSDEIVSLGDYSDTSIDENSVKKKLNDFHISDDESNSPKQSFLKTKRSNSVIIKDEPIFPVKNDGEMALDTCEAMAVKSLSESQNQEQEIEKKTIEMKPKPRILPIKSISSEYSSSLEADNHFKPSPRPRSLLVKHSHREEKDGPGEEKETEEPEARSVPLPLPRLNGRTLTAEKKASRENLDSEDAWLTSLSISSPKESLEDSLSPGFEEKSSIKDQNEEVTENQNSLKSSANEENSLLIDAAATTAPEKSSASQLASGDLEEEKEKTALIINDHLTADAPLKKSQSILLSPSPTESTKKTIEDRNMKNKKTTNNRVSSASGRLMTSEFLKKSSSGRRTPLTTTSSQYLGTLKVLDQKPSQKHNLEPDRADSLRAAVYQEWLEKKNVYLHEMHRIKRIESENLRIQNEQKRAAKKEEALASFEAWKAMKEKEARRTAAQKRLEEKNKKKTEEENAARKGEALQAFEKWKEKKMEYFKEKNKKEKESERAKKKKEEESVAEKRKDNLTAVEKWNEKKEAFFKEKEKEKINEKRKEELKRAEKKDKDKQAIDEYDRWLEKKEKQERSERRQKKRRSFLENETHPPWNPPSRTVFSKVF
ncbi:microtubule-associated protein 9 isoform X2 [Erinaceus europaeus]|uniref:Microtubule-associated protein 9 isoform X2 n=1 Tax=Erinaceus europaeus TaxID=9365 RepID=A0A1S3WRW4_ERIEU|nr:microtubule-associated protein 9 isoform X2 [Erinaceus europaeus]